MDNQTLNQSIPTSKNNSSSSINKIIFFIAEGFLLILIVFFLFFSLNKKLKNQSNNDLLNGKKVFFFESLSKYDKDSDGDGYPDFIEEAVGLDKNVSEVVRCQENSCEVDLQTTSQKKMFLLSLMRQGAWI